MKKTEFLKNAGFVVLSVFFSLGAVALAERGRDGQADEPYSAGQVSYQAGRQETGSGSKSVADLADAVMPSVVGIASGTALNARGQADYDKKQQWSMGSGIIVTKNGYILTNQHVTGNPGTKLIVTFSDGTVKEADHVWKDENLDLALVKVGGDGYPAATLGNVRNLRVGDSVIAVGNPLSMQFQRTVTGGLISAVNRTVSLKDENGMQIYMDGLIQTDASINPGNSGGPLVNSVGEVVGVNTIKLNSAEGIGFAVPINIARPVIEAYEKGKSFVVPYLGVEGQDNASGRYMGAPTDADPGVIVTRVDTMSPAYQAGIRQNDVITHVDKRAVNSMMELREELFRCDGSCTLTIISGHAIREVKVSLRG